MVECSEVVINVSISDRGCRCECLVVVCSEVVVNMYPYLAVVTAMVSAREQLDQVLGSLELKLGESRGSVPSCVIATDILAD